MARDFSRIQIPQVLRFLSRIKILQDGCWEWTATLDTEGYGLFKAQGSQYAHRFSYQFFRNEMIPQDKEIDHLCRNRKCVNPNHLEIVTHRENCQRGILGETTRQRKLSRNCCSKGHPYNSETTYRTKEGWRVCRICKQEGQRQWRARTPNWRLVKNKRKFLALPIEERRKLLAEQASNPDVIAYYENIIEKEEVK